MPAPTETEIATYQRHSWLLMVGVTPGYKGIIEKKKVEVESNAQALQRQEGRTSGSASGKLVRVGGLA